jgi:hypothetical protein
MCDRFVLLDYIHPVILRLCVSAGVMRKLRSWRQSNLYDVRDSVKLILFANMDGKKFSWTIEVMQVIKRCQYCAHVNSLQTCLWHHLLWSNTIAGCPCHVMFLSGNIEWPRCDCLDTSHRWNISQKHIWNIAQHTVLYTVMICQGI